jgi:hypothetical protein
MTCPRAPSPGIFARSASSFGAVSPGDALERGLNELDVRARVEESAPVRSDLDGKRGFSESPRSDRREASGPPCPHKPEATITRDRAERAYYKVFDQAKFDRTTRSLTGVGQGSRIGEHH